MWLGHALAVVSDRLHANVCKVSAFRQHFWRKSRPGWPGRSLRIISKRKEEERYFSNGVSMDGAGVICTKTVNNSFPVDLHIPFHLSSLNTAWRVCYSSCQPNAVTGIYLAFYDNNFDRINKDFNWIATLYISPRTLFHPTSFFFLSSTVSVNFLTMYRSGFHRYNKKVTVFLRWGNSQKLTNIFCMLQVILDFKK